MNEPLATMIAAVIAALTSLATLLISLRAGRHGEMRAAHRVTIQPYLEGLSQDIHEVIAGIVVVRKRVKNDQAEVRRWLDVSKAAGDRIKTTRQKTTYVLPGLAESFRELSLASDHVATYKDLVGTNADELVAAYKVLADRLNAAIENSYRTGVPTGWIQVLRLNRSCSKVRKLWSARPA